MLGSAEQDEEPEADDHDQSGTEQRGGEAERGGDEFAHDPPDRQSSCHGVPTRWWTPFRFRNSASRPVPGLPDPHPDRPGGLPALPYFGSLYAFLMPS
ncbi:hypothetical protein Snoj_42290 [Streptomyces nojiriensis]|uniref:Uncharacterized protein n=1 Tax=Streptomyces nojiriensis TaxID=66374 RepID=A0ABQ3SQB4_9ACTN|nr:hypothetical protein GCM10010205_10950 [Streptomyces nojiriensis]GHI70311.1 hypothetical protein Snoj_42290 [Streptomyces nojiriensis]